jgi:hypothetical protein
MVNAETSSYAGWTIETYCYEDKPEDWKPGDPIPYKANLLAKDERPAQFPDPWTGPKRFTIPEHGAHTFQDWNEAYRALKREAHDHIDALKSVR